MNIEESAALVIEKCEAEQIGHMLACAFATSFYGVPRSTADVDFVVDLQKPAGFAALQAIVVAAGRLD